MLRAYTAAPSITRAYEITVDVLRIRASACCSSSLRFGEVAQSFGFRVIREHIALLGIPLALVVRIA